MLDVDTIAAEMRAALEAYNAMPEQGACKTCQQDVHGRIAVPCCDEAKCPVKAILLVRAVERDNDGTWTVRPLIDYAGPGLIQYEATKWVCRPHHEARLEAANAKRAAEQARAEAERAQAAADEAQAAAEAQDAAKSTKE